MSQPVWLHCSRAWTIMISKYLNCNTTARKPCPPSAPAVWLHGTRCCNHNYTDIKSRKRCLNTVLLCILCVLAHSLLHYNYHALPVSPAHWSCIVEVRRSISIYPHLLCARVSNVKILSRIKIWGLADLYYAIQVHITIIWSYAD